MRLRRTDSSQQDKSFRTYTLDIEMALKLAGLGVRPIAGVVKAEVTGVFVPSRLVDDIIYNPEAIR